MMSMKDLAFEFRITMANPQPITLHRQTPRSQKQTDKVAFEERIPEWPVYKAHGDEESLIISIVDNKYSQN